MSFCCVTSGEDYRHLHNFNKCYPLLEQDLKYNVQDVVLAEDEYCFTEVAGPMFVIRCTEDVVEYYYLPPANYPLSENPVFNEIELKEKFEKSVYINVERSKRIASDIHNNFPEFKKVVEENKKDIKGYHSFIISRNIYYFHSENVYPDEKIIYVSSEYDKYDPFFVEKCGCLALKKEKSIDNVKDSGNVVVKKDNKFYLYISRDKMNHTNEMFGGKNTNIKATMMNEMFNRKIFEREECVEFVNTQVKTRLPKHRHLEVENYIDSYISKLQTLNNIKSIAEDKSSMLYRTIQKYNFRRKDCGLIIGLMKRIEANIAEIKRDPELRKKYCDDDPELFAKPYEDLNKRMGNLVKYILGQDDVKFYMASYFAELLVQYNMTN